MDIKQIYREETELDVYTNVNLDDGFCFSNEYVKWLEAKINYTRCSTQLKDKKTMTFTEWIELLPGRILITTN